jgi:protein TonB
MKKFVLFLAIFIANNILAQEKDDSTFFFKLPENTIFNVDEEPTFPGGINELIKFLSDNINYPQKALDMGIEGKCYIKFTIDTVGNVIEVSTLRGVPECLECDEEAMRVIKLTSGKWTPAIQNGKHVNYNYMTPITYKCRGRRKIKKNK